MQLWVYVWFTKNRPYLSIYHTFPQQNAWACFSHYCTQVYLFSFQFQGVKPTHMQLCQIWHIRVCVTSHTHLCQGLIWTTKWDLLELKIWEHVSKSLSFVCVKPWSILKTFIFKVDTYAYVSHFSKSHGIETKLARHVPHGKTSLAMYLIHGLDTWFG